MFFIPSYKLARSQVGGGQATHYLMSSLHLKVRAGEGRRTGRPFRLRELGSPPGGQGNLAVGALALRGCSTSIPLDMPTIPKLRVDLDETRRPAGVGSGVRVM